MDVRTAFAAGLMAALAGLAALIVLPFLDYVLVAMLLAFTLRPVQRRLAPRVGGRPSALVLLAATTAAVVAPAALFVSALADDVARLLSADAGPPWVRRAQATISRLTGVNVDLQAGFSAVVEEASSFVVARGPGLAGAGLHSALGTLLLVFLLYYLLVDGPSLVAWTRRVAPLPHEVQDELFREAERTTWAVLKGHVFVAGVQGVVAGLGLVAVGVPNAWFWTVVMVFLAMVPLVGVAPVLGGAVAYLALSDQLVAAGFVVVWGLTVVAVTDDYLRALVIDRESSLHAAVILLGVFGGAYLLGVAGLFVGPVVVGLAKTTAEVLHDYYGLPG